MADNQASKVTADIKRNRLYITLSCDPSKKVLEKVYTDVRFCVADLKPGFDVITDLSQCTLGHLSGISTLRKIMTYLVLNQAGEVVRVTGRMSLIFRQLIRIASKFQGYKPVYVTTLEEAEDKLTNSIKRNGLRFHIHRRQIGYRVDQEEGKGDLIDISISGCAVLEPTVPLSIAKDITLFIPLHQDQDAPATLTIAAKVVRIQDNMFATQFLALDDDQKILLFRFLAYEARREIPEE
jgi:hypothetical protein